MPKPMVEPKDYKKRTYIVTEENGAENEYTFSQLCALRGIKYHSIVRRVEQGGMTVAEAFEDCRTNPNTWGATYFNKSNVRGMPKQFENGKEVSIYD